MKLSPYIHSTHTKFWGCSYNICKTCEYYVCFNDRMINQRNWKAIEAERNSYRKINRDKRGKSEFRDMDHKIWVRNPPLLFQHYPNIQKKRALQWGTD